MGFEGCRAHLGLDHSLVQECTAARRQSVTPAPRLLRLCRWHTIRPRLVVHATLPSSSHRDEHECAGVVTGTNRHIYDFERYTCRLSCRAVVQARLTVSSCNCVPCAVSSHGYQHATIGAG